MGADATRILFERDLVRNGKPNAAPKWRPGKVARTEHVFRLKQTKFGHSEGGKQTILIQ